MDASRKKILVLICGIIASALLVAAIFAVGQLFVASLMRDLHLQSEINIEPLTAVSDDNGSEYVLADSDSRYYSREELNQLSSWDLYIANNEIYARHGRGFERDDLMSHFATLSWYQQLYSPEEYDAQPSQLNDFEQANAKIIGEIRRERNDPYL